MESVLKENKLIGLSWAVIDYDDVSARNRVGFWNLPHKQTMFGNASDLVGFRLMPLEPKFQKAIQANWSYNVADMDRRLVAFQDESEGKVTSWKWDFGDGSTSTEQNSVRWDNGLPGAPTDTIESHPYLFSRAWGSGKPQGGTPFFLRDIAGTKTVPHVRPEQAKLTGPIIINEYDWLWLDRSGNPTCLIDKVYASLLGENSSVEQRRRIHARYVAALTEFWRCHRKAAGVLHFCSPGYSRDGSKPRPEGGATSDDWLDVRALRFEPYFAEYVKEAFSPVGLMLDFWVDTLSASAARRRSW